MILKLLKFNEYDSDKKTWKNIYERIYQKNLTFEKYSRYNGRLCITSDFKFNDKRSLITQFSGDTDFNFKKDSPNKRGKRSLCTDLFIILSESENKEKSYELTKMLDDCCNKIYKPENVSILPTHGALQLVKQNIGRDRLDTFIWCIDKHYKGESLLFNHCAPAYIDELKSFLELFNTAEEYCKCIYHIDEKLTKQLILSGGQPIDSIERIQEYIILANKFWHQKKNYLLYGEEY